MGAVARCISAVFSAASLGGCYRSTNLAECASIDELKDTMSRWFASDKFLGGHEGAFSDDVSNATDRIPPDNMLREDANKVSKKKEHPARKLQRPQTVELPNKPPSLVPEAVTPQGAAAQSTPSQPAPLRLHTPFPEAPSSGTFSRIGAEARSRPGGANSRMCRSTFPSRRAIAAKLATFASAASSTSLFVGAIERALGS